MCNRVNNSLCWLVVMAMFMWLFSSGIKDNSLCMALFDVFEAAAVAQGEREGGKR